MQTRNEKDVLEMCANKQMSRFFLSRCSTSYYSFFVRFIYAKKKKTVKNKSNVNRFLTLVHFNVAIVTMKTRCHMKLKCLKVLRLGQLYSMKFWSQTKIQSAKIWISRVWHRQVLILLVKPRRPQATHRIWCRAQSEF